MAENKDESVILVPADYTDGIIEHPHMALKGEATVTCNIAVKEPQKQIGQKVVCNGCAQQFEIKRA